MYIQHPIACLQKAEKKKLITGRMNTKAIKKKRLMRDYNGLTNCGMHSSINILEVNHMSDVGGIKAKTVVKTVRA